MVFISISMALVSIAKGAGAFALLTIANHFYHIALDSGGWYLLLHPVAVYLVLLGGICLYDSAVEFMDILSELFGGGEEDIDN